jgi:hypothetical protein
VGPATTSPHDRPATHSKSTAACNVNSRVMDVLCRQAARRLKLIRSRVR